MLILKAFYFKFYLKLEVQDKLEVRARVSSHTRTAILLVLNQNVVCRTFHACLPVKAYLVPVT